MEHTNVCRGLIKQHINHARVGNVQCRFYSRGSCTKGNDCTFLHEDVVKTEKNVCSYFLMNNCKYGKKCKDLHLASYASKAKTEPPKKKRVGETKKEVPFCTHFQQGICLYGNSCFKRHVMPLLREETFATTSANKPKKKTKPVAKKVAATVLTSSPQRMAKVNTGMKVCEFYIRGNCAHGNTCSKSHQKNVVSPARMSSDMKIQSQSAKVLPEILSNYNAADNSISPVSSNSVDQGYGLSLNDGSDSEIFMSDSEFSDEDCSNDDPGRYYVGASGDGVGGAATRQPDRQPTNVGILNGLRTAEADKLNSVGAKTATSAPAQTAVSAQPPIQQSGVPTAKLNQQEKKSKGLTNRFEVLEQTEDTSHQVDDTDDEEKVEEGDEEREEDFSKPAQEKADVGQTKKAKKKQKMMQKLRDRKIIVDNLRWEGNNQYQAGNFNKAVSLYTSAITKSNASEPDAKLFNNRAAAFMKQENYRCAFNDVKKCLDLDNSNSKAACRLMKCCLVLGLFEEGTKHLSLLGALLAETELSEYEEKFGDISAFYKEAVRLIEKDKYHKAEPVIDKALLVSYQSSTFYVLKATIYALQIKIAKAEATLEKLDPKDSAVKMVDWYYFLQGLLHYYKNDLERSISGFVEAKKLRSENKKAYIWFDKVSSMNRYLAGARRCVDSYDYEIAIEYFTEGLSLGQDNQLYKLEIYKERSVVYTELEDYTSAIKDVTLALAEDDSDNKLWLQRGKIYLKKEEYEKALEDLQMACSIRATQETRRLIQQTQFNIKNNKENFYKILGVSNDVTKTELKQQFHKKAKQFHPDKHSNATPAEKKVLEEKMKDIARAYSCLSDEKKRAEYDRKLNDGGSSDDDYEEDCFYDQFNFSFAKEDFFERMFFHFMHHC